MRKNSWTHSFSLLCVFSTLVLILAGALVTSTGSGLAVPDWPLSYGQYFPEMKGGVFFEHGHRMIAGFVGLMILTLALLVWVNEKNSTVKRLAAYALGGVVLQALLGGMTVLYGLPREISIFHASLAQAVLCLLVSIAFFTSNYYKQHPAFVFDSSLRSSPGYDKIFKFSLVGFVLVFLQLVFGASLRHRGGALSLNLHLTNAFLASFSLIYLWRQVLARARTHQLLFGLSTALISILIFQVILGTLSFLPMLGYAPYLTGNIRVVLVSAHVLLGAAILSSTLLLVLASYKLKLEEKSHAKLNSKIISKDLSEQALYETYHNN